MLEPMPAAYGAILTAWAAAGVVGAQICVAFQDRLSSAQASIWPFIQFNREKESEGGNTIKKTEGYCDEIITSSIP